MYLNYKESNVRTLKVYTFYDIAVNSDYTSYIKVDYTDYNGNNGAYYSAVVDYYKLILITHI